MRRESYHLGAGFYLGRRAPKAVTTLLRSTDRRGGFCPSASSRHRRGRRYGRYRSQCGNRFSRRTSRDSRRCSCWRNRRRPRRQGRSRSCRSDNFDRQDHPEQVVLNVPGMNPGTQRRLQALRNARRRYTRPRALRRTPWTRPGSGLIATQWNERSPRAFWPGWLRLGPRPSTLPAAVQWASGRQPGRRPT